MTATSPVDAVEPTVVHVLSPLSTIYRAAGEWQDWSKQPEAAEGVPMLLHLKADPVETSHLPGGVEGRHLYRAGYEYSLSPEAVDDLRGAGFGGWITSRVVRPAVRHRVHESAPGLGDALTSIEILVNAVGELRAEVAALRQELQSARVDELEARVDALQVQLHELRGSTKRSRSV